MAYENKGSMATTVTVSLHPDVSGNFVCNVAVEAHDVTIQRALDHVETVWGSGEVIVKPGEYFLDAKIEVPSFTIFRGLASPHANVATAYLRLNDNVDDDVVGNKAGADKVEIRNFDIYGNSANQANGHGINIDADYSIIDGNTVNNIKENGINSSAQVATIRDNRFLNIDGNGINSTGSDTQVLFNDGSATGTGIYVNGSNHDIIGNRCHSCGVSGIIVFTAGDYATVTNNRCNDNTGSGMSIAGQWSVVSNNRSLNNSLHGIIINVVDVTCSVNHCYSNDQYGIHLGNPAHRCSVVGNDLFENGRHGIVLENVEYVTVTGNVVMNNGQAGAYHGIWLYGSSSNKYNVISSNTVSDDQTGVETQQDGIHLTAHAGNEENLIVNNICNSNQRYGVNILAGPVNNRVFRNELTGNGTGAINDLGTDTRLPWIFCRVTDPNDNIGTHPAVRLEDNTDTDVYDQFYVPLEYQELVTANVVVVAAASGDMVWTVTTNWGKLCTTEAYNENDDADNGTEGLLIDDLECVDISAALTGIAPGDLVGVDFMRDGDDGSDTIEDVVYYLGIRVRYV